MADTALYMSFEESVLSVSSCLDHEKAQKCLLLLKKIMSNMKVSGDPKFRRLNKNSTALRDFKDLHWFRFVIHLLGFRPSLEDGTYVKNEDEVIATHYQMDAAGYDGITRKSKGTDGIPLKFNRDEPDVDGMNMPATESALTILRRALEMAESALNDRLAKQECLDDFAQAAKVIAEYGDEANAMESRAKRFLAAVPDLLSKSPAKPELPAGLLRDVRMEREVAKKDNPFCLICLDAMLGDENGDGLDNPGDKRMTFLGCGHFLHRKCYEMLAATEQRSSDSCPVCRVALVVEGGENPCVGGDINIMKGMNLLGKSSPSANLTTMLKRFSQCKRSAAGSDASPCHLFELGNDDLLLDSFLQGVGKVTSIRKEARKIENERAAAEASVFGGPNGTANRAARELQRKRDEEALAAHKQTETARLAKEKAEKEAERKAILAKIEADRTRK